VTKAHFAKNILLPKLIRVREINEQLSKTDLGKAFDVSKRAFKEERNKDVYHVLHLYQGTREHVFYDKVRDIVRSENKSTDKNTCKWESAVLDIYNIRDIEVFRFEYRLNYKSTLASEVNTILNRSSRSVVHFKDLFQMNLASKIVNRSWARYTNEAQNQIVLKANGDDSFGLLLHVLKSNSNDKNAHGLNKVLQTLGIIYAIKTLSLKALKEELSLSWSARTLSRTDKKVEETARLLEKFEHSNFIRFIDSHIVNDEALTKANIEEKIAEIRRS